MNREEIIKEAKEQVNCSTPIYPESFIQGYLAGAEPRENKIADIKANCDLAIEGRNVRIMELEESNKELKKLVQQREQRGLEVQEDLLKEKEELKKENRLLGERCNQLLKDKGNLTDELQDLKDRLAEEVELHLHAEEYSKSLEEENNKLLDVINNQDVKIADLEKKNAELKSEKGCETCTKFDEVKLTKATKLLNEFMRISKASDEDFEHDYSELIRETEQFIIEVEK